MKELSKNTLSIKNSIIRDMFNKAAEYDDAISFTVGEPDFTASAEISLSGCKAIIDGNTKYTANKGILPLRQSISDYLQDITQLSYDCNSEIVVTVGAMGALFQTFKTLLNPGDEVILISPCWTNYIQQVTMCGGIPIEVPTNIQQEFQPDIELIKKSITPKTKAILLNSPSNPTGAVIKDGVLEQIADIAIKNDLYVISDEVYRHITFDDVNVVSISSIGGMKERTIIIDSFSKTFAMTGWRIGYAAGPEKIISNIGKLQENIVACAPTSSQYAAVQALKAPKRYFSEMTRVYKERRDYIWDRINKMPRITYNKTSGTFYAFVYIGGTGLNCEEFAYKLLETKHVVVVPGTAFGKYGENYIRISFATSMENISKGMDLLEEFLNELEQNENK